MLSRIAYAALAIIGLIGLLAWAQADDEAKQQQADAWARGFAAGRNTLLPTVGDAWRQGMLDGRQSCTRDALVAQGARP